jgi:hypothetical protein
MPVEPQGSEIFVSSKNSCRPSAAFVVSTAVPGRRRRERLRRADATRLPTPVGGCTDRASFARSSPTALVQASDTLVHIAGPAWAYVRLLHVEHT